MLRRLAAGDVVTETFTDRSAGSTFDLVATAEPIANARARFRPFCRATGRHRHQRRPAYTRRAERPAPMTMAAPPQPRSSPTLAVVFARAAKRGRSSSQSAIV